MKTLHALERALAIHGLHVRGAFMPEPADAVPDLADGRPARALLPVGNVGSAMWRPFTESAEYRDGLPNPLDRWSRRIGDTLARRFDALALYPFGGPPHHPFLRWARRAGRLPASPLGLLIDPEAGLWHAYRFALAFDRLPEDTWASPIPRDLCTACTARSCLTACPVGAFDGATHHASLCANRLGDPEGDCLTAGCHARRACPVGVAFRYDADHERFHLASFHAAHGQFR